MSMSSSTRPDPQEDRRSQKIKTQPSSSLQRPSHSPRKGQRARQASGTGGDDEGDSRLQFTTGEAAQAQAFFVQVHERQRETPRSTTTSSSTTIDSRRVGVGPETIGAETQEANIMSHTSHSHTSATGNTSVSPPRGSKETENEGPGRSGGGAGTATGSGSGSPSGSGSGSGPSRLVSGVFVRY
ncbi:hypothetical protein HRR83_001714 [Exophiala dermatitidis]|uniref:Uncharacterized protein n=2 Tax=Exophiala dermatitidis TaxID=5970 RepID=H6C5M2_EXODN|nr:uncharacterized protein HMPREF1120_07017 [Exophiala dermatitidis NIH/UT8656]KAJ4516385.1 hypothetical protein HRR73_004848 [Exophiala dermatitidis]EHY59017.1 hypothetical protein HMPREF1120_07017 [Exophiala dermatitidis NIH/UT8656]KAJ4526520.1 hypothetical protein HRR74_001718 [Exophiala dermatitidis]KAJ4532233.1 hypothetical protein HRR76_007232 [Exophiala dermatitidis]KAJ4546269.1 hypothetical protein HRR77_004805 [Exophiala dermatitidis]